MEIQITVTLLEGAAIKVCFAHTIEGELTKIIIVNISKSFLL